MKYLLVALIRIYQWTLSPFLMALGGPGTGCRFEPSCSEYCLAAVRTHGSLKGSFLAVRRLCRCHPWGGCGWDPVPEPAPTSTAEPRRDAAPSPHPL